MTNRFKPTIDLNSALRGAEVKVIEVGARKAYGDNSRARSDVQEFPKFVRLQVVDDPTGINSDAELQVKLRNASGIEVGEQFIIDIDHKKIVGGQLTFWPNQAKYHGHDWVFVNTSGKGDRLDDWK